MYDFINDFITQFSKDFSIEDDENISINDVLLHTQKVENFSYIDTSDFVPTSKNEGESSNNPIEKNLLVHSESTNCTNTEKENEEYRVEIVRDTPKTSIIEDTIIMFLEDNGDKNRRDIEYHIAEGFELDVDSEDFAPKLLEIESALKNMEKRNIVERISDNFSWKYHLVEENAYD